jgi:PPOX class probable F420-dependent enzyme
MSERDALRMSDDEVRGLLDDGRRMHVATLNPDGSAHLVPMTYLWFDGRLAMWTDPGSRKVHNLRRDPRITCLVETGDRFEDYRAVQLVGDAEIVDGLDESIRAGELLTSRYRGPLDDATKKYIARLARSRVVVVIEPKRIVSWDHRKLAGRGAEDVGR